MKTPKIKATYIMLPLIGCPGAEGASWALPADAESYDAMVEQMAKAGFSETAWNKMAACYKAFSRRRQVRALRAIGITPPKKGRK